MDSGVSRGLPRRSRAGALPTRGRGRSRRPARCARPSRRRLRRRVRVSQLRGTHRPGNHPRSSSRWRRGLVRRTGADRQSGSRAEQARQAPRCVEPLAHRGPEQRHRRAARRPRPHAGCGRLGPERRRRADAGRRLPALLPARTRRGLGRRPDLGPVRPGPDRRRIRDGSPGVRGDRPRDCRCGGRGAGASRTDRPVATRRGDRPAEARPRGVARGALDRSRDLPDRGL